MPMNVKEFQDETLKIQAAYNSYSINGELAAQSLLHLIEKFLGRPSL